MTQTRNKLVDLARGTYAAGKTLGRSIKLGIVLSLPIVGASIVLNGAEKALRYGMEKTIEPFVEHRTYDATLVEKKEALLLGTHGRLGYGNFELESGDRASFHDGAYLSEGKFWENTRLSELEEGQSYSVSVAGNDTLGWTLLNAEKN